MVDAWILGGLPKEEVNETVLDIRVLVLELLCLACRWQ